MILIIFALFPLLINFIITFLPVLSAQILCGRVLSNHWMDCSEILGHDRYGCEDIQQGFKIKNVGLYGLPTGMPKTAQILSGLFPTNHSWDVSIFLIL